MSIAQLAKKPPSLTEQEINFPVNKSPLLDFIQILINAIQTFIHSFFMIHFGTSLSSSRVHHYGFAD
jgi:hypothetical protein